MPTSIHFEGHTEGIDLEVGAQRRSRRKKPFACNMWGRRMLQSFSRQFHIQYKLCPIFIFIPSFLLVLLFVVVFIEPMHGLLGFSMDYRSQVSGNSYVYAHLRNLVMVAGHAVYTGSACGEVQGEDSWFLESYQKHPGQAATFIEHIKAGVDVAEKDNQSLLLFSGGETRKEAGPRSEAQSYWAVAESKNWFGKSEQVRDRAMTEEHARDSLENLLFSICRFRELTGAYPLNITVVSYDFKQFRFVNLHRAAIHFPASRFAFRGTLSASMSTLAAQEGELKVQESFRRDPYGCDGSLRAKRIRRDPFLRTIPYPAGCPEIKDLFSYCGGQVFPHTLPWDN